MNDIKCILFYSVSVSSLVTEQLVNDVIVGVDWPQHVGQLGLQLAPDVLSYQRLQVISHQLSRAQLEVM